MYTTFCTYPVKDRMRIIGHTQIRSLWQNIHNQVGGPINMQQVRVDRLRAMESSGRMFKLRTTYLINPTQGE